jgi:nicotinate phosphoribosyltransferase
MPGALITDLYELNMAASYLRRGMRAPATFSLFIRDLPPSRGFLVAAGIEDCLTWLEQLSFEPPDLEYLTGLGFDDQTLSTFAKLRFSGEVWAVREGQVVTADEPLLEVTAPIAEAQLVETALLNLVTFQTTVATKAARCRLAAAGRIELIEFGFRRTQGVDAGIAVARLSVLAGFSATSNVEAARRYGLQPSGTMAHSYIEAFPSELEAFRTFAQDLPTQTTFLVDTYDTREGVAHAIEVIRELGLEDHSAIRLDSGDLVSLARAARTMLDRAELPRVRIIVSGGLDEHDLARFVAEGAPIDAAGVGTRLGVSADAPYLDSVYKLVAYDGRPVAKRSTGKATLPGAKQVFRGAGFADTLALRDEPAPPGAHPLLEQVMTDGGRLRPPDALATARSRLESDLAQLPSEAQHLVHPVPPVARWSASLERLVDQVQTAGAPQGQLRRDGDT